MEFDSGSSNETLYERLQQAWFQFWERIEIQYKIPVMSKVIDPLEMRGIPTFPTFLGGLLLILALVSYAAYAAVMPTPVGSLSVEVLSNGKPVSGATVELKAEDGSLLQSINTSSDGTVLFSDFPVQTLSLRAFKVGYGAAGAVVDAREQTEVQVKLTPLPEAQLAPARPGRDSDPWNSGGSNPFDSVVGSTPLCADDPFCDLKPLPTGTPVSASPKPGANCTLTNSCNKTPTPTPNPGPLAPVSVVSLRVIDSETGAAIQTLGHAKLVLATSNTVANETDVFFGVGQLRYNTTGARAYLVVTAANYSEYANPSDTFALTSQVNRTVNLTKVPAGALNQITQVQVLNAQTKAATSATVVLLDSAQVPLTVYNSGANGKVNLTALDPSRVYAVAANKTGFFPVQAPLLIGGITTLSLTPASLEDSTTLVVKVIDAKNDSLPGASVNIRLSDGTYLTGQKTTDSHGTATFSDLARGAQVRVEAGWENLAAIRTVSLDAARVQVDLSLLPERGQLTVLAVDAATRRLLDSAQINFSQFGKAPFVCEQNGTQNCTVYPYVAQPVQVTAKSPSGLAGSVSTSVVAGEPAQVVLPLITIPANGVAVTPPVVKDVDGRVVTTFLPKATYFVEFNLIPDATVTRFGFYARAGSQAKVNDADAAFSTVNRGALGPGVTYYSGPVKMDASGMDCRQDAAVFSAGDLLSTYQQYVDLRFEGNQPRTVRLGLYVYDADRAAAFELAYRAWARSDGYNDTVFYGHNPLDAVLKDAWNATGRDWCHANLSIRRLPLACGYYNGPACPGGFDPCEGEYQSVDGKCVDPILCGTSKKCIDNQVCCAFQGDSVCREASECPPADRLSCPPCQVGEYCDTTGGKAACTPCDAASVASGRCTSDCGQSSEMCCGKAGQTDAQRCQANLQCGGFLKSEVCGRDASVVVSGDATEIKSNCDLIEVPFDPVSGEGQVGFQSQLADLVYSFTDAEGVLLNPSCAEVARGYLSFHAGASSCGLDQDGNGNYLPGAVKLRMLYPATGKIRVLDVRLVSQASSLDTLEAVTVTRVGNQCVPKDEGSWRHRRLLSITNLNDKPFDRYPVRVSINRSWLSNGPASLRVVTETGFELPTFQSSAGIGSDFVDLWIPVDAPAKGTFRAWVYYDNPEASLPAEQFAYAPGLDFARSSNSHWEFDNYKKWRYYCNGRAECPVFQPTQTCYSYQTPGGVQSTCSTDQTVAAPVPWTLSDSVCQTTNYGQCGQCVQCTVPAVEECYWDEYANDGTGVRRCDTIQEAYTARQCPPCGWFPATCAYTTQQDARRCPPKLTPSESDFYVFDVPTGVLSVIHDIDLSVNRSLVPASEPLDKAADLFEYTSGNVLGFEQPRVQVRLWGTRGQPALWTYAGEGEDSYNDLRVSNASADRLVYAISILNDTHVAGVDASKKVLASVNVRDIRVEIARPVSYVFGEEESA